MRIPPVLFLFFLLLGLLNGLLSSNPDSIIVQGPEDNEARTAQIQQQEHQQQKSENLEESRGGFREGDLKESLGKNLEESRGENLDQSRGRSNGRNMDESRKGNSDQPRGVVVSFMERGGPVVSRILFTEIAGERLEKMRNGNGFPLTWQPFVYYPNRRTGNQNESSRRLVYRPQISRSRIRGNNGYGNSRISSTSSGSYESEDVNSGIIIVPNGYQVPKNNGKGNNAHENSKPFSDSFATSDGRGVNSKETLDGSGFQTSQNNGKRNNDNAQATPKPVDSTPAISEGDKVFFDDDMQANPSTKSTKRISADSNFFAGIVNDFAFKLMDTINLESNFVISPLSIYIALAMCYLGSDGRTKAQLEQALGMNDNAVHGEHLHKGIKDLISSVREETPGYQLFLANGMLLGKNFTVDGQFAQFVRRYYDAEILNLDFADADLSLRLINRWVAENTRSMITSIINSPPPPLTRLVLLNAIFFKGIWKMQFPIHLTKNGKFHTLNRTENEVVFMNLYGETFPVYRSEQYRHNFIKLPYENDEVSMIIALPFTARERPMPSVRDQNLCVIRDAMVNTKLGKVSIPKFRLEDRNSLKKPLEHLGITDIFDANNVDLSKLRSKNDVFASTIFHKAVIDVDEVGTTAAASTDIVYEPLIRSASFEANHPFAFYVIHEPTGLVLFYGKIFNFESESDVPNERRQNPPKRQRPNSQSRG